MTWYHPYQVARRADTARLLMSAVLGLLVLAFFRVQVLGSGRYQLHSDENRLRPIPVPSARGLITDRNGRVLAENVPGYSVGLIASSPDSLRAVLARVARYFPLDSADIRDIVRRYRRRPFEPAILSRDAPFDLVSTLEERRMLIPGLVIQAEPKRRYPFGSVTAHVVGYVNEMTEAELASARFADARMGALVGRDGLEREYDEALRGRDGRRFVEVDARGRTVRAGGVGSDLPPEQGATVRTTIDIELQQFVASTFPRDARGAVMVMDPRQGEVLAVYSSPTYDPNAFIGGIDPRLWNVLQSSEAKPMFDRAISARYPPASPWKLAVAAMALRRGLVDFNTRMPNPCRGGMQYYNRYFRCWRVQGHGDVTLTEAIQNSCDVYFYQLGLRLGLDNMLQDAGALGFREPSGVDLPGETRPTFPPNTDYYDRLYGPRGWTRAVTLNLAIGQGENAQTLSNMMRFYAMLANEGGAAPAPYLVRPTSGSIRSLGLPDAALAGMRHALFLVVEEGTAVGSRVAELRIAGKTGTAQNPHGADHGWFIAFAPAEAPRVVVGAIVEFAEHGSSVARIVTPIISRHLLGTEAAEIRLVTPADSAPDPLPVIRPDTLAAPIADANADRGAR
jgi:penicillin-binding protein 2